MRRPSMFKVLVLGTFLVVAALFYYYVILLYFGQWKTYFMRSGNFLYWVYLTIFTWIYVQIIKYLWKLQVRVLT